ncbi:MAG: hypothetical protein NZM26_05520, partial [Patescibacteria group bacterium]|nr:hypothetical protein [Patescibacteria group bacterium]
MKIFNLADEEIVINFDLGYSNLELAILVAVMSFFVGIFSFFYITKYRGYFFFWLAVFSLSMIGFTLSDNLVLTFVFWEGLGFSSYFLVRFYGTLESESRAKYVFLFNRVGDLGFLILIAGSFFYLDTLSLTKIVNAVKSDVSGHEFDLLGAGLLLCA